MTYQQTLEAAGWPTELLVLDFETYFDDEYSLRKMSTVEYVSHYQFETLGLGWQIVEPTEEFSVDEGFVPGEWVETCLLNLQHQYGEHLEQATVVAQNAPFDGLILVERYNLSPRYFCDLLGLARHIDPRAQNDLASLAKRHGLSAKGDTSQFKGQHVGGVDLAALTEYALQDVHLETQLTKILLPWLSRPEVELPLIWHTLKMYLHPELIFDDKVADEVIKEMNGDLAYRLLEVGCAKEDVSKNGSFRRLLESALPEGESVPLKKNKKGKDILALAKTDPELDLLKVHPCKRVRDLIDARCTVKSLPLHIRRLESMKRQAKAAKGKMRVPLKYCGAHTGRWSGGEKINLQNLRGRIRNTLIAPPGHVLVVGDAASIEARGTDWIAGQMDSIARWEAGEDQYCAFAQEVFQQPVRPVRDTDPGPVAQVLKLRRTLGKIGVLGCGFGMGADRCMVYAHDVFKIDIDRNMAEQIVKGYRDGHDAVVRFWRDLEGAFIFALKYGQTTNAGHNASLTVWKHGDRVIITLPSGRNLFYPGSHMGTKRWEDGNTSPAPSYRYGHLWGGSLTENIVQAFCRDILAEAILHVEKQGVAVAHHVHDELVCVVPTRMADETVRIVTEALTTRRQWALDLPLGAEVKVMEVYTK